MNRNYLLPCIAALVLALAGVFLYLHSGDLAVLDPKGPVASEERWIIVVTVLLCSIVVIPVFILLFYFAWKYRETNPKAVYHHQPDWDHLNGAAEFVWWLVPSVIIFFLSIVAWQGSHALDPFKPLLGSGPPITVEVVALDWKWLFIYPQYGIASVNMLEFPVESPVHFEITADAPMNSFWIPSLGGQIMAMPGMDTQLNLEATSLGSFRGLSGNLSGEGFAGMTFTAQSVSQSDFDNWVQVIKETSAPLTPSAYSALEAPSSYSPVAYYSPVDSGLYTGVMMKFMMPAQAMEGALNGVPDTGQSTSTPAAPAMPGIDMGEMPRGTSTQ